MADGAAVKAYFRIIWDDIPPEWQTFFMTVWVKEGAVGGGAVPTRLDEIRDEMWEEMVFYWPMYRNLWSKTIGKISAGEPPVAAPPVWPASGVQIKGYVESIWESLTEDWRDYYLETLTRYYNYNNEDISLPANLEAVPAKVWTYMHTAWNGSRREPEDAQSIFEHLALAVNMGMSPDDENLEFFIYAG
jgi:hypothetical protein